MNGAHDSGGSGGAAAALLAAAWHGLTLAALAAAPAGVAVSTWRHRGIPGARPFARELDERLGGAPRCTGAPAWIHAASVGEVRVADPLVLALRRRLPEVPLVLSATTARGRRAAASLARLLAAEPFHPPLDAAPAVARALARVAPRALITVETEIWPNLFRAAAARGIRVAVVNGRFSERALPRYAHVRPLLREALAAADLLAMRSDEDAHRALELGAPPARIVVTGDLKSDAANAAADAPPLPWVGAAGLLSGEWVAFGSTASDELEIVLDAFGALTRLRPGARALLAPRRPDQWDAAEESAMRRGITVVRRSRVEHLGAPPAGGLLLLDTVGELARLYRHASVAFVGGSLVPRGGQNILEPAAAGAPVLFGPHLANFRDAEEMLLACGGGLRVTSQSLAEAACSLLADESRRRAMGIAARDAVRRSAGATERTMDLLAPLLLGGA